MSNIHAHSKNFVCPATQTAALQPLTALTRQNDRHLQTFNTFWNRAEVEAVSLQSNLCLGILEV